MLFNSLDFAIFLPIVFACYWFVLKRHLGGQNVLLLLASYVFYGWWDYRFLTLIAFSTVVDFTVGKYMAKTTHKTHRKLLLWVSIVVNLGLLGFFKYSNFFIASFVDAFTLFGVPLEGYALQIILPVGISFYTFQTLSYTIDVYRNKLTATTNFVAFATFVSFFPQLVAGPIERASHLLPQFKKPRVFTYEQAVDGLRQILWGLFKKVVIADNCATFVNTIFNNYDNYSGSTLLLGAILFAFQIYGDFSGYSDIAIGTARLFGFNLKQNFAYPYFSRDIAEFWRRWHISLSTWFRDYVYIPLGGSRGSKYNQIRNVFIIFIVSGFWHGANWTFIIWGALNAIYFLPLLLMKKNKVHTNVVAENRKVPNFRELGSMMLTFLLVVVSWIFFRADSMAVALGYIARLGNIDLFSVPAIRPTYLFLLVLGFLMVEWVGRRNQYAIEKLWATYPSAIRWTMYYTIAMIIFLYGNKEETFIYFQF